MKSDQNGCRDIRRYRVLRCWPWVFGVALGSCAEVVIVE